MCRNTFSISFPRYVERAPEVFRRANFMDPINDFKLQLCKLGTGLMSGEYSRALTEEERKLEGDDFQRGIRPVTFKQMIGKGHPEFSGKNQQDAQEFFLHLCTVMEREHHGEVSPAQCLQFEVEDRIECGSTGQVGVRNRDQARCTGDAPSRQIHRTPAARDPQGL